MMEPKIGINFHVVEKINFHLKNNTFKEGHMHTVFIVFSKYFNVSSITYIKFHPS
jgi:hypothetical protein